MAQMHAHQRPMPREKFVQDIFSDVEKELAGTAIKIDRLIIESIADELYRPDPSSKQIVSLLEKTKTGAPRYYSIITRRAEKDTYLDDVIRNSYKTEGRRHFLKISGGTAILGTLALAGVAGYLNVIAAPPVVPPVTTTTTEPQVIITTPQSTIDEQKIREKILASVPKVKDYSDVLEFYPRKIMHTIRAPRYSGNPELFTKRVDLYAKNLENQIEYSELSKRAIPLHYDSKSWSDRKIYGNVLGDSLLPGEVFGYQLTAKSGSKLPSLSDGTIEGDLKNFEYNLENFELIQKDVEDEMRDQSMSNKQIKDYKDWTMNRTNEVFGLEDLGKWMLKLIDDINANGTYHEKVALVDRGFTISNFTHDEGRPITKGRVWTVGAAAYTGSANFYDRYLRKSYFDDGFTLIPLSDPTLSRNTGALPDSNAHAVGVYSNELIKTLLIDGRPFKNVNVYTDFDKRNPIDLLQL